jgi:hypothetical protein
MIHNVNCSSCNLRRSMHGLPSKWRTPGRQYVLQLHPVQECPACEWSRWPATKPSTLWSDLSLAHLLPLLHADGSSPEAKLVSSTGTTSLTKWRTLGRMSHETALVRMRGNEVLCDGVGSVKRSGPLWGMLGVCFWCGGHIWTPHRLGSVYRASPSQVVCERVRH